MNYKLPMCVPHPDYITPLNPIAQTTIDRCCAMHPNVPMFHPHTQFQRPRKVVHPVRKLRNSPPTFGATKTRLWSRPCPLLRAAQCKPPSTPDSTLCWRECCATPRATWLGVCNRSSGTALPTAPDLAGILLLSTVHGRSVQTPRFVGGEQWWCHRLETC